MKTVKSGTAIIAEPKRAAQKGEPMAGIDLKLPIQVNLPDDWIEQIVNRLRNDPEAEWVEIVRCMDCENWIPGYITDNDDFIPPKCGKYQQMVGHSSDDYCSLAERRTDEGD